MNRNVRLFYCFNFLVDFRLYSAVAIVYFASVAGSYARAASVFSAVMIATAVLEIPTGVFSDRIGRKWTLVSGAAASAVGVSLYAAAGGYGVLLLGSLLEGAGRALKSGNNEALLYETLVDDDRVDAFPHVLGRTSAMFQVAAASAAAIGGVVASWSFTAVMWLSAGAQVATFALALLFTEPRFRSKTSGNVFSSLGDALRIVRHNRRVRRLVIAEAITVGAGESNHELSPAFIASLWPLWAVGVSRAVTHAFATAGFFFGGRVIKRTGVDNALVSARIAQCTAAGLAVGTANVASPIIWASGSGPFGVASVAAGAIAQEEFTDSLRATLGSLLSLARSASYAAFALALGVAADRIGLRAALAIGVGAMLTALPVYGSLRRRRD